MINAPSGWIRPAGAKVSWLAATSADGPLSYQVVLDGRPQPTPPGAAALRLGARGLGDGKHQVQVLATDADGAATLTPPSALLIDGQPPIVRVRSASRGKGVIVSVSDAASGVESRAVGVSFGDGARARGRSVYRHTYARPGVYQIVARVRDRIGNQATIRRLVSVA